MKKQKRQCDFCGRPESEVGLLIQGVNGAICNDCIRMASEILDGVPGKGAKRNAPTKELKNLPKPVEIKAHLDQYVIGQDEFCIEWSKRDTEKGELLFHKNGTLMEIKTYKNVGPISNKASYNRFISVEDFAKLLNMSVEVTPYAMKFTRNS